MLSYEMLWKGNLGWIKLYCLSWFFYCIPVKGHYGSSVDDIFGSWCSDGRWTICGTNYRLWFMGHHEETRLNANCSSSCNPWGMVRGWGGGGRGVRKCNQTIRTITGQTIRTIPASWNNQFFYFLPALSIFVIYWINYIGFLSVDIILFIYKYNFQNFIQNLAS